MTNAMTPSNQVPPTLLKPVIWASLAFLATTPLASNHRGVTSTVPTGPRDDLTDDIPADDLTVGTHDDEPHTEGVRSRLNWLRAGVLGANDGIVSTAGLVVGVAGATTDRTAILIAGVAGLTAGALSMAAGEYVSVSTQRDSELSLLDKERRELAEEPEDELAELAQIYVDKGLSEPLALQVARELTEHDALAAHAEAELGIDPNEVTSAWAAAWASLISFTLGALLPLLTITLVSPGARVPVTVAAVAVALAITGWASAKFGYGPTRPAVLRNVGGGLLAMLVTFGIGSLLGTQI
jgi:VIT1/CCC1 family predicted Fe2+/Mn2+ transporter